MVNLIYARFKNFQVFSMCMGKDEIILDRRESPNILVILNARNGGGKSSLMSELSPLAIEHTLTRTSRRIIPGRTGEKELHFLVNERYLYICNIIYQDRKTSAYISKRDLYEEDENSDLPPIELNPSGLISTYEEILERELGFNKNYVKIGYLSPDMINFIAMKPTERSNYISTMLPDVSMFLKSHDIVLKKSNEKKREIDNINKELGKLSTINYENQLNQLKDSIDHLEISLDKIKENITKGKVYLDSLEKFVPLFSQKEDLLQKFLIKENELKIEFNKIKMLQETLDKYSGEEGKKQLSNDLIEIEKLLSKNKETIYNIQNIIEKLNLSIREKTSLLDNKDENNVSESLESLLLFIENYTKELNESNNLLNRLKDKNSLLIEKFDNMDMNSILNFSKIMDIILNLSNKLETSIEYTNLSLLYIKANENENSFNNIIKDLNNLDEEILKTNEEIALLKSNEEMKRLYSLKENCMTNTCKILQELEKYINIDKEKEVKIQYKTILEEKKNNLSKKKEEIENNNLLLKNNIQIITSINSYIKENSELISTFSEDIKNIFKSEDISEILKSLKSIQIYFNDFKEYIHLKDKITQITNSLNELKIKKNIVISKSNLEKEVRDLEENKLKLNNLQQEIQELEEKKVYLDSINEQKNKLDLMIQNYEIFRKEMEDFRSKLKNIATIEYYYNHIRDILIKNESEKILKEKDKSTFEKEREFLKTEFINKQQLEKLRNDLIEIKRKYDILVNIWSSKTGYPSIVLNNFLLQLKELVNRDLDEIWDNSLSIDEFIISQTEFSIVMNREGVKIEEASMLSQGEKAILSIALSFSIIEMNLSERIYDVIRLDEVDGALDPIRSARYLTMLKNRLERMGVSSCFVITHKENFDAVEADMVLLKGANLSSSTLSNKNIIFKAE